MLLALALLLQPVQFVDVAPQAGIRFQHSSGSPEKKYILESMGSGLAWIDYDRDGCIDLYAVNGGLWEEFGQGKRSVRNALFRNNCDGTFSDVSQKAGAAGTGWGMGATAADFDNDGWDDLYVCNYGPNNLYRNNGDGTFSDVSSSAGAAHPGWSSSAAWADADQDGDLDLYVANYLVLDLDKLPPPDCHHKGLKVQCGPKGLPPAPDVFYRNNGDGTFTDATQEAGLAQPPSFGLGAVWADYDNDGDADLYVANDGNPNFLFRNLGQGRFEEAGTISGSAYNEDGQAQAGMGVDFGDYDGDGDLDIYVTNFSHDYNTLYRNLGSGIFRDVSYPTGVAYPSRSLLGWGAAFFDYDHDGRLDLVAANGHVYPQVDRLQSGTRYAQPVLLLHNRGEGKFEEAPNAGPSLSAPRTGRGLALADYDNDGDLDFAVNNQGGPLALFQNRAGNQSGHWISIRLEGFSVGARVTLKTGQCQQIREVRAGSSYQSSHDRRLHFGLGAAAEVRSLQVRWPDGALQSFQGIQADRFYAVQKGGELEELNLPARP